MSTITISNLPAAGALTGTEVLPIVQSNVTSQTTVQDIANLAGSFPYSGSAQITGSLSNGLDVFTSGDYSHAEGQGTTALGLVSHAEGFSSTAGGLIAIGDYSHAEGVNTRTGVLGAFEASISNGIVTFSGSYGDVSGVFYPDSNLLIYDWIFDNNYNTNFFKISQSYFDSTNTIIELYDTSVTTTTAYVSLIFGSTLGNKTIPGTYAHAEGASSVAVGLYSHAEGGNTVTIGFISHAEGGSTTAKGGGSHAEGSDTLAIGNYSHAEGGNTTAIGGNSHAEGLGTVADTNYMHASGRYNMTSSNDPDYAYFVVGNGLDDTTRSNAFRVNSSGQCFAATTFTNGGADYAEFFESFDGSAIPLGTVVELTGSFIKPCTVAENAIGVISNKPSVLGNSDEGTADEWIGKYKKDIWGNYETIQKEFVFPIDKNKKDNITYITESRAVRILNPNYDPTLPYIPRAQRPEWNIVGLVGQIKVLKNQPVPSRWIKMSEVSSQVDLYLVK